MHGEIAVFRVAADRRLGPRERERNGGTYVRFASSSGAEAGVRDIRTNGRAFAAIKD